MAFRDKLPWFRRQEREAKAVSTYGWARIWLVVKEHWLKLIGLNVLYVLCCLPVITIPAATCGLHRVILNWVRETSFEEMVPAFFREFRQNFVKRAIFGLLFLIAPFSLSCYPMLLGSQGGATAVFAIAMILYFSISKYFYPLLVLLDVTVWQNFKNACIMAVLEWRTTLRLLGTAGILDLLLLVLTAYTLPLYLIVLCAFNCLLGCAFANAPFEKYFGGSEPGKDGVTP